MLDIYCVCGEWKRDEKMQWDFEVDDSRRDSLFDVEEEVSFSELVKIITEDFDIKHRQFSLSYGLPQRMKAFVKDFLPIAIGNDRQLRTFINKRKVEPEMICLCLTVGDIYPPVLEYDASTTEEVNVSSNINGTFPTAANKNSHGTQNVTPETNNLSSTYDRGEPSVLLHPVPDLPPLHTGFSPSTSGDIICVNRYFKNKAEMITRMKNWALEWKFEFRTLWSNKERVILGCVDAKCTWRMRATRLPDSQFFVVKKYVHGHTCDTTHRNANHRQASAKLLGFLICSNYGEKKDGLNPKQIIEQVRIHHGVQINYKQAWRVKEEAQNLMRGTPEDSYYNLSKWLFKLQETNPGSKTYIEMDSAGKFKYTFVAFGASIREFSLMRRVIAVDGTFLKGKFKGTLLGASAQDGNFHLYPLAFAIVDSENEEAWSWFFRGLTFMIPDAEDLVFVSDRAQSIAAALANVYPRAHHGICRIHLINNIKTRYGKTGLIPLVESAANAYTVHEFNALFSDIRDGSPSLAKYLVDADVRKWARCFAPGNRYNIMTTNIAESLNSMLKMPRELPIISLLETIRLTLTTWFHERREAAKKNESIVTPRVVKKLVSRYDVAMTLNVYQVDRYVFEVKDEARKFVVNLEQKHCTCNVFDIDRIPCIHAVAAAKRSKLDENKYVDAFYSAKVFAKAYAESIHPCGDLTTCEYPEAVAGYSCPPPKTKQSSGRPPTKRIRSVGEFGVPGSKSKSHKCSRCGVPGHNKSTCRTAI